MNTRRLLLGIIVLLCALALVSNVLAMRSDNYWLDWFTPLTGGGGGPADSANYTANFTVGQTAIGAANSANYAIRLGYWLPATRQNNIYLPLVIGNDS